MPGQYMPAQSGLRIRIHVPEEGVPFQRSQTRIHGASTKLRQEVVDGRETKTQTEVVVEKGLMAKAQDDLEGTTKQVQMNQSEGKSQVTLIETSPEVPRQLTKKAQAVPSPMPKVGETVDRSSQEAAVNLDSSKEEVTEVDTSAAVNPDSSRKDVTEERWTQVPIVNQGLVVKKIVTKDRAKVAKARQTLGTPAPIPYPQDRGDGQGSPVVPRPRTRSRARDNGSGGPVAPESSTKHGQTSPEPVLSRRASRRRRGRRGRRWPNLREALVRN
jgi:hypothetical protein